MECLTKLAKKPQHGERRLGVIRQHGQAWWALADCSRRICVFWPLDDSGLMHGVPITRVRIWPRSWYGWPLGLIEARLCPTQVIVYSPSDFFAASHFIFEQGMWGRCGPVAILHPGADIPLACRDSFKGKRVRLFPPVDDKPNFENRDVMRFSATAMQHGWQIKEAGAASVQAFDLSGLEMRQGQPVRTLADVLEKADRDEDPRLAAMMKF